MSHGSARAKWVRRLNGTIQPPNAFNLGFDVSYAGHNRALDPCRHEKWVVFGLPRSGNTWLTRILASVLSTPIVDPWTNDELWGVGMCHRPLDRSVLLRPDFVQACVIVRDMRDVVASYLQLCRRDPTRIPGVPWTEDPSRFYHLYLRPRLRSVYEANTFAQEYAATGLPVVRFEDLVSDAAVALSNLVVASGITCSQAQVQSALDASRPPESGDSLAYGAQTLTEFHFDRGIVGNWRTVLGLELGSLVHQDAQDHQSEWGYK